MGILGIITMSIALGLSIILPESQVPLTGETFIEHLRHFERVIVTGIPLILEQVFYLGPEAVKELARRTTLVVFGGAPLDKAIGDSLVAEGVQLRPTYGSYVHTLWLINYDILTFVQNGDRTRICSDASIPSR